MPSPPSSRLTTAPEIPTTDEAGLPGFYLLVLARLLGAEGHAEGYRREAERRGGAQPGRSRRCARSSIDGSQDIFPREQLTPEALGAFQKAEIDKWWPIIKAAGIKAE